MRNVLAYFLPLLLLLSCKRGKEEGFQIFPAETDIEQLNSTEFVLSQKNSLPDENNVVYCPSFLFAWNEVRSTFAEPITLEQSFSEDLLLINQDTCYRNSLDKSEYKTSVEFRDGAIMASAYFHQLLPFQKKFQVRDTLFFRGRPVQAFGIENYDEELAANTEIRYYKSDNNFVIALLPRKPDEEIILCRSIFTYTCMQDLVRGTDSLMNIGKAEKNKYPALYRFTEKDRLLIPAINFNISKRYNTLEGQGFSEGKKRHKILRAFQRTAFILNEQGAEAESNAMLTVDSAGTVPIRDTSLAKNLIFDKPFFILLRKKNNPNPYFTMLVKNTELMKAPEKKSTQVVIKTN